MYGETLAAAIGVDGQEMVRDVLMCVHVCVCVVVGVRCCDWCGW